MVDMVVSGAVVVDSLDSFIPEAVSLGSCNKEEREAMYFYILNNTLIDYVVDVDSVLDSTMCTKEYSNEIDSLPTYSLVTTVLKILVQEGYFKPVTLKTKTRKHEFAYSKGYQRVKY